MATGGGTELFELSAGDVASSALAEARAVGTGSGAVSASATAVGGEVYSATLRGDAHAIASASGNGLVTAAAEGRGGGSSDAHAIAFTPGLIPTADVFTSADSAGATASFRSLVERGDTLLGGGAPRAELHALPDPNVVPGWLASSPEVGAAASESQVVALGFVQEPPAPFESPDSQLRLDLDRESLPDDAELLVGFLDASMPGFGFAALEVQISLDGDTVFDEHYFSPSDALAGLEDRIVAIHLGPSAGDSDSLSSLVVAYSFDSGAAPNVFMRSEFAVLLRGVPEPAAAALAWVALATLLAQRIRSQFLARR
jgi:hypothetical protein